MKEGKDVAKRTIEALVLTVLNQKKPDYELLK